MKYSQNNEEEVILKYFKDQHIGTFLEIGAYHPEIFSNVRALYEKGWKGVLVEPAQQNFDHIKDYYKKDNSMQVIQTCIGSYNGEVVFYDSQGDAIGTTDHKHMELWKHNYKVPYKETKSTIVTFETLLEKSLYKRFDFISIDVEGKDFEVLTQINFNEVGCSLVCIEYNGKEKEKYHGYFHRQQFRHIYSNGENLIYGK